MSRASSLRRAAIAGCAAAAMGCGEEREAPSPPAPVTGSVRLERPEAGPPDAGTRAGHGADAALGRTSSSRFRFTGTVSPPDSLVALRDSRGRARATVRVAPSGRFTATVRNLARGVTRLALTGRRPGRAPWRMEIRVIRLAR